MQPNDPDVEISKSPIDVTQPSSPVFTSQRKRSRRAVQLAVLTVILIALIFPLRGQIAAVLSSNPTVPTATHGLQLYIQTNVSQGTLTVNGKAVPIAPNDPGQLLKVASQHMVITLHAPPFTPLTCTIDHMQLTASSSGGPCSSQGTSSNNNIATLDMNFTPDNLPTVARQQFDRFIATYLTSFTGVQSLIPAGEHYASGADTAGLPISVLATMPLEAQAWVTQSTGPYPFFMPDCSQNGICAEGPFDSSGPPSVGFSLAVILGWRFYDTLGNQIAMYVPADPGSQHVTAEIQFAAGLQLNLTYAAATGWSELADIGSAASQIASNSCQELSSLLGYALQNAGAITYNSGEVGQPALNGCLIGPNNGSSSLNSNPMTDTSNSWFMVHFGALLAVNDKAHVLLPQLPRATANEVNEVWHASKLQPTP